MLDFLKYEHNLNDTLNLYMYLNYVHTLGNLTLTGYNSELSNNLYEEKSLEYKKSNFTITRTFANTNDKWTSTQIIERAKILADIILKIWSIPDEYNKELVISSGIYYDFNSDVAAFKHIKPYEYSIAGNTEEVKSWREILFKTIQTLYKEDCDIFLELLNLPDFPGTKKTFTTKPTEGYQEVVSGIFVYPHRETKSILSVAKTLIENFDNKRGSDIQNDIWFTVRKQDDILSNLNK